MGNGPSLGGFFLWPAIFFPFALFGLYRPVTTLIRYIVRSTRMRQRLFFAAPFIVSAVLAAGAWALEVYDPREAPWTIYLSLPKPGCRQGPDVPSAIAGLSEDERRRWLNTSFTTNNPPPPALANLSFEERQRWWTLINLSSYDSQGALKGKYDGNRQFWLENKCWPNAFYYLTAPIYTVFGRNRNDDADFTNYNKARRVVQESFEGVLLNSNRFIYDDSLNNSWTAYSYRISFFLIAWMGVSGIFMALFFTFVSLRDPKDASEKRMPTEDALLCLMYSMGTVMTWIPFRTITEYIKYKFSCNDITKCEPDIVLYIPDGFLAFMLFVGFFCTTISMLRKYRRLALTLYGTVMTAVPLLGAYAVYHFPKQVASLAGYWQFYLAVSIPSSLLLFSLWYLFDPSKVHFEDFQKDIEYEG